MNPLRVSVRFPVTGAPDELAPAIPTFHRFIQRGLVEGLLLDVADYRHVPDGPGVMLIAHDVDYGVTARTFTVVRKRSSDDPFATQLRDLLRMGLGAIQAIDDDHELAVTVDTSRFEVSVLDRQLGSRAQVEDVLRDELAPVVTNLYGAGAKISPIDTDDPRHAPALLVTVDDEAATAVLKRLGGSQAPGQSPWDITPEELARLREGDKDLVVVDVREDSEYQTVNLGGVHIPLASLQDRLDELDRDTHLVVHCRAGHRGAQAVTLLREAGFDDAWNVNGGLIAWIDRVDPTLPRY